MRMFFWTCTATTMLLGCSAVTAARNSPAQHADEATLENAVPPTLFAQLFHAGKVQHYRVETLLQFSDDDRVDPRADDNGVVRQTSVGASTCVVEPSNGAASADVALAHLDCDGALTMEAVRAVVPDDGRFVVGAWAATSEGLWRIDQAGEAGAVQGSTLTPSTMLLSSRPQPTSETTRSEDGISGAVRTIERVGGAWCVKHASWGGDQQADMFCFEADRGLVSGMRQFSGSMFSEVRFCLEESDCRALPR